jgi:pimeloyl-ACP methyl ester carboxylesterase
MPREPFVDSDDVAELLDHLRIKQAMVVGSSFGGRVALELAASRPELVGRLLLLCPAFQGLPPTPAVARFTAEESELLERGDIAGVVELNVRTWLGPSADEPTRERVRTMQRRALELQRAAGDLPETQVADVDPATIHVPALVVTGHHDMDHFQAIARHLVATLPQGRLLELPWAGHLPSLERPAEVTGLLGVEAVT